jgi:predicted RNase H-like HicB family nuclease
MEIHDEEGGRYYLFRIVELPAVVGDGASKSEALDRLRDCFDDYISWRLDEGLDIAPPARGLPRESSDRERLVVDEACAPLSAGVVHMRREREAVAC